jgi:gamma-glutamyltranspeptidase/glutathione hydrolase
MQWTSSKRPLFKAPAVGSLGMVCCNHPIASAAGVEVFSLGGNAIDAAVASLFCLSVVEPMMVGIAGGGITNIRLADGRVCSIDNYSTSPAASSDSLYTPLVSPIPARADARYLQTVNDESNIGLLAVGVPGTLKAWCHILREFGSMPLAQVMGAAIRHAEAGFPASQYLCEIIADNQALLARFPASAAVFLPTGRPPRKGELIVQADLAASYRTIAAEGESALYGGAIGARLAEYMAAEGGLITLADLQNYSLKSRYLGPLEGCPTLGTCKSPSPSSSDLVPGRTWTITHLTIRAVESNVEDRGYRIVGACPCSAGGIHLIEMLNILESVSHAHHVMYPFALRRVLLSIYLPTYLPTYLPISPSAWNKCGLCSMM